MTAHGPGRVPGVRRLTDAIDRLDARDGAQEARTGRWPDHPGTDDDQAARALADMTRQRDEAVKAFQRERARVSRVEALRDSWLISAARDECRCGGCDGCTARVMTLELRAALADRPTDDARKARGAAVGAADDAEVAGQGSDAERPGEGK